MIDWNILVSQIATVAFDIVLEPLSVRLSLSFLITGIR